MYMNLLLDDIKDHCKNFVMYDAFQLWCWKKTLESRGEGGSGPRLTPEEVRFLVLSLAHRASSSSSPSLCGHRLQSCVSAWLPIDMAYAGKDTLTFGPEQATHGALS